jgi:DNA-binding transcriptional ArsR family regulator
MSCGTVPRSESSRLRQRDVDLVVGTCFMNESAIGWAWRQSAASTEKLVLLALASVADSNGAATPTIATLASMCGVTRRSVQRTLRKLLGAGLVRSEARRREDRSTMSNRYRVAVAPAQTVATPNETRESTAQLQNRGPSDTGVTPERHIRRWPDDADVAPTATANPDQIRHEKRRPLFPELAKVVG